MSNIHIVYAPQGAGKTRRAAELMRGLGAGRLVDNWTGEPLQPGDLALTNLECIKVPAGAELLTLDQALRLQAA